MNDTESILNSAAHDALEYLTAVQERRVGPSAKALADLSRFEMPFPEAPTPAAEVLATLHAVGSPATVASAGPRYFGFVIGGTLPVTVGANWLATAWDQNAGLVATSPVAAKLEEVVLDWLRNVFHLPPQAAGALVSGANMANFTGLAAARRALLLREGWDVDADGLFGAPPLTVIVSDEVHVTVSKSLGMLGLGRNRVVRVPTDGQGRMRADRLPKLHGPTLICLQAGNVNTGAFDPATEICAAARDAGAWVHVDGAFGLWAWASPQRAQLLKGFELASSWAVDSHKWLNTPYDCALAFVREPDALRGALATTASYLEIGGAREPYQYTPEFSRRARGVDVWAALRHLGRSGLADLIERTCVHASRIAQRLRDAGHEILNDVVLNQVLVSFGAPERTRRIVSAIQQDGTCWCSGTVWQGKTAMRISVSSWATTAEDIERSADAIVRIAAADRG